MSEVVSRRTALRTLGATAGAFAAWPWALTDTTRCMSWLSVSVSAPPSCGWVASRVALASGCNAVAWGPKSIPRK